MLPAFENLRDGWTGGHELRQQDQARHQNQKDDAVDDNGGGIHVEKNRDIDADIVATVGKGHPGDDQGAYVLSADFRVIVVVIVVTVASQAPHEGPDADAERDQTQEADPFVRDDRETERGDHADHDECDEPEVLACDDLPRSRLSPAGGEEQHGIGNIVRPCDLAERNAELELLGQAGDQPVLAGRIAQHAGKHRRIGGAG